MTRLIDVLSPAPRADWDRIVAACPYATFAQTPAWADVCAATFPSTTAGARLYRFDDDVEVLLPGTVETAAAGALREFNSAQPSDCAGLLSVSRLTAGHAEAVSDDLRHAGFGAVRVYENPFSLGVTLPGFSETADFTHAIPVDDTPFMSRVSSKSRQKLRKGLMQKVTIESHCGGSGVEDLYAMYVRSAERWGDATTWLRPFDLLREACARSDAAVVRLARFDGVVIGGLAEYYRDRVAQIALRGFDYEFRSKYANLLLIEAAYREAQARGAEFLDMGASAGLDGVIESKERVGAVGLGFRVMSWEHPVHHAYLVGRRRLDSATAAVRTAARH